MRKDVPIRAHPAPRTGSEPARRRPESLPHAFAPVHKRALGVAVGSVVGLGFFFVTAFHVVLKPAVAPPLALLSQYFFGYEVSWWGAFVGLFWGFFTGFVAGWFVAFVRNLATATKVFIFRTKGELAQTKDFLDHI
jgi:hypothetical protein